MTLNKITQAQLDEIIYEWTYERKNISSYINCAECDFSGLDFFHSSFTRINFNGCCFDGARMATTKFAQCSLMKSSFIQTELNCAMFKTTSLTFSDFSESHLMYSTFINSNCTNSKFVNANLVGTEFFEVVAQDSDFTNADLSQVDFDESDLCGCIFDFAKLIRTEFYRVKTGLSLSGNFTSMILSQIDSPYIDFTNMTGVIT